MRSMAANARGRTVRHGEGNGPVQLDHGRRLDGEQVVVELHDVAPVRRGIVDGHRVRGRDGGLDVIGGDGAPRSRAVEMAKSPADQLLVPGAAVLLGEEQNISRLVHARGQTACLQQHEREEGMHRGLIRGGIPGENLRQPYRLAAELGPGQVGAAVRAIALVEEEVEDVEHAVEAAAQLVLRGNLDAMACSRI
jgi:hypothetical protein